MADEIELQPMSPELLSELTGLTVTEAEELLETVDEDGRVHPPPRLVERLMEELPHA